MPAAGRCARAWPWPTAAPASTRRSASCWFAGARALGRGPVGAQLAAAYPDRADGLPGGALPERRRYARTGRQRPSTSSPMGLFEASDGAFNLGASGEGNWKRLCDCLNAPQWLQDPRYATEKLRVANRAPLNEALARRFREASVAHWVAEPRRRAGRPGLHHSPGIRGRAGAAPGRGTVGDRRRWPGLPPDLAARHADAHARRHRPARAGLGRAHRQMLAEAGYDAAGIARLRAEGVV